MSEDLIDEITSINSIYGENTLVLGADGPDIYAFTLPNLTSVTLRLEFPPDYPDAPPSVLGTQSVGNDVVKGTGAEVVDMVRDVLAETYLPGTPCIFDLIEESHQRILQHPPETPPKLAKQTLQAHGQPRPHQSSDLDLDQSPSDVNSQSMHALGEPPPWAIAEPVSEKKSVFIARAASVESVDQAKEYLQHLLTTDKKAARATHNITAWRVRGEHGVQFQDCDDDGETAAGGRLLHLLELMNIWNAMVVVTRWYGGVHLGSDRFRIINQVAREALVSGGFVTEAGKENKKKSKR